MKFDINKYQTYFFDFDGVIVDSLPIKTEAFGSLFENYGEDFVRKVKKYHLDNGGVSRYEKFRYYYEVLLQKSITTEIIKKLDEEFSVKVKDKVISAAMIEGVSEFLCKLREKKKEVFLISGTPEKEVCEIVTRRGLNSFFKEVVGSPTTKEENLKSLMKKYQIQGSRSIFFGDAASDYEAAVKCLVDFVAVMGEHNEEIFSSEHIYKIRHFGELI